MNNDLEVAKLYSNSNKDRVNQFKDNVQSNFTIESNYEKCEVDLEWLEIMEETVRYLDNIYRNPNRFIVNEEEIVNVEKARRVTVETIKHLSRHTNFIQEISDKGEVRPSKILNINKDESFNTYENRIIYTLIQNMMSFIEIKKKNLVSSSSLKDVKKCEYNATSKVGAEKININLSMDTKLGFKKDIGTNENGSLEERIERLEYQIKDLTNSDVYKMLAKAHVARVIPPIKKTNLVLKNVNFQYAMKLWDYLQNNIADKDKRVKSNKVYENDFELKNMFDDTFLLNYLVVNSVSVDGTITKEQKEKVTEELTNKMINKIVEINSDLPIQELQTIIGDKIAIAKIKKEASLSEIQAIFSECIDNFINKIDKFSFR